MKRIKDWTEFKKYLDRGLSPQEIADDDNDGQVNIILIDGQLSVYFRAYKGNETDDTSTEWTEYKNNYQSNANKTFTDSNGIPLQRTKITRTGWHFQLHGIEFCSSKLNSIYNKDKDGNDLGFCTIKFYDNTDTELVAGTQAELDSNCVKTVLTWQASQDVEVIGGFLEQANNPANDIRMWIMAIPDYPVGAGGSIPFSNGGINLKYLNGATDLDGKTPKLLPYNGGIGTNKFEVTLRHEAGDIHPVHILFKLFRENV